MATKKPDDPQPPVVETAMVKCRVLSDCYHGSWGEVVTVEKHIAEQDPALDPHPDAVAYAESQLAAKA